MSMKLTSPEQVSAFRPTGGSTGLAALEMVICGALAFAVWFVLSGVNESSRLRSSEQQALHHLQAIAHAQVQFFDVEPETGRRFAGLGELIGRADDVGFQLPAGAQIRHRTRTLVIDNYCFAVFLASRGGEAQTSFNEESHPEFFVAYAWPLRHGRLGRRIFVVSSDSEPRFWHNATGTFHGTRNAPPPGLATPPEDSKWPFALDRPRWFNGIRWYPAHTVEL